ncbi:CmpA/NrtA family ABC transporter substrate-binding protein [Yinghuangia seranimata]|uniref:CmpA/NrtA family ABC transporter substrate-binding protein n=1 Tax=Yinghuangia seranimata TaxID=408067 RepID=UPI00248C9436|nr:CmpA/NrtA family ABC transporter substrate-binding protein [Yinghuangia seranimata]MDI2132372.1 CmpA/NrtA family ABC transporter substrate-binding protein [Yinghuangia seranimata]
MDRRSFLRAAGGTAVAAGLTAACGGGNDKKTAAPAGSGAAPSGPKRKVKLGFIALTDCASIVMAQELGYFAKRGLDVTVEKQQSWATTRDALLNGQIDGAHCLFGMPFSVASGIGGDGSTALKIAMVLNHNGQAITLKKGLSSVGYGDLAKAKAALEAKENTLAMTFPGGTHDIWLRYWLRAAKVDPKALKIITIPPPQMVANMKVDTMDGYCVGEPWNAVAVDQGIGFTHLTSQDLWRGHPEKALVVNEAFASGKRDTLKDVMAAVLEASRWLDDPTNRKSAAATIAQQQYVNAPAAQIEGRLTGRYQLGAGLPDKTYTSDMMRFFDDGQVNTPLKAHGLWFLAQYQRLGIAKGPVADPAKLVDSIILSDLYKEVADAAKVGVVPDMQPFDVQLDAARFDPNDLAKEVARA